MNFKLAQFCRVCPIAEIISELDSPRSVDTRPDPKTATGR